jgi:hypothetical protein
LHQSYLTFHARLDVAAAKLIASGRSAGGVAKLLSKDEAPRIATNIAKLPPYCAISATRAAVFRGRTG